VPVHLRYHKPSANPQASHPSLGNVDNPAQQQPIAIVKMQVKISDFDVFLC